MRIVTGVFDSVDEAERAVRALLGAGFTDDDIGVVTRDSEKGAIIADDLGRDYVGPPQLRHGSWLSRSDVFNDLPEGYDTLVKEGGLPGDAVTWYRRSLDEHGVLVLVNAGERMDDTARILRDHNGRLYGTQASKTAPTMTGGTETVEEIRVPVIEEEVTVQKTAHEVGEVRVTSETTTREVEIPTTITHEEIRVERRKLDHPITPEEYREHLVGEGTIRMPIIEEEVRVMKVPVVREELIVTRVPSTERKTFHETVMHAEPRVETTGDVDIEGPGETKKRPAA